MTSLSIDRASVLTGSQQHGSYVQARAPRLQARSARQRHGLHLPYRPLPLLVTLLAEGVRAGVAEHELTGLDFDSLPRERQRDVASAISRRETGVMAISALLVLFLALRAAGTSGGLL